MTNTEDVIDPDLPICDPHHHLWDRHGHRYLLDELLADTGQADAHGGATTCAARCSSNVRRCTAPTAPKRCARWARPSSSTASRR